MVRRTGDRVVAGVAAAVGRRYGIDPVLVRILFAVTTFAAGLGALAYLVLWVALPLVAAPAPPQVAGVRQQGPWVWLGAIAITIGAVIALGELPAPRILVPVALITVGIALWQRPGGSGTAPGQLDYATAGPMPATTSGPTPPASRSTAIPASWQPPPVPGRRGTAATTMMATGAGSGGVATSTLDRPAGAGPTGAGPTATPAEPDWEPTPDLRWWVPPTPRPRPSWLGPITIAVALVVTGVVALLGRGELLAPTGADLMAVALFVLAGGMVVGAFRGRAKWLALPALALSGVLVLAQGVAGLGIVLTPTAGTRTLEPVTLEEPISLRHGFGEVVLDLTETDLEGGQPIDVELIAGQVQVIVPEDAQVELRAGLGVGAVVVVDDASLDDEGVPIVEREQLASGDRLEVDRTLSPDGPVGNVVVLDVGIGAGELEVFRGDDAYSVWRQDVADEFGFGSFGPTGDDGGFTLEFDLGEGGTATIESQDDFRGFEDATTWFHVEGCPGSDVDDDLLAECLDRVAPVVPSLDGGSHSLPEEFFLEECGVDRVLDDPERLLEPCLRLVLSPDATDTPSEGER